MKHLMIYSGFFLLLSSLFISCNRDDDGNDENSGNSYTYMGRTINLNQAEYYNVDDDVYIFLFQENNYYDYVTIIFANSGDYENLDGIYILNDDRYDLSYDPETNFWHANISYEENVLGDNASAGQVTINRQGTTSVHISFQLTMPNGDAIGTYDGSMRER